MPSNSIKPGGTSIQTRPIGIGTWNNVLATPGTTGGGDDTSTIVGANYASIWVPGDCLVTGISFLQGTTAATTKAIGVLYDEGGSVLAYSLIAGTTMATASTRKALAFTAPYQLQGPGVFFIGLLFNGTGSKFGTIPSNCHNGVWTGTSTQAFPTVAADITTLTISASTPFSTGTGPIAHLY